MSSINHVALMTKMVSQFFPTESWPHSDGEPRAASEDMSGAYRQIPLLPAHIMLCLTAVWHSDLGKVQLHEMFGQPFGAAHAVPNFYRFAEWVCRALRRWFHLMLNHFFDDFFVVEPTWSLQSAMFCFREGC